MGVEVNYWAILLGAVASMVVGMVWYMPAVFGNAWMKMSGVKPDQKLSGGQMATTYGLTFLGSLLTAYVLAHVAFLSYKFFQGSFLESAFSTAVWLWLGFTAIRLMVHDLFDGRRKKLTLINAGYELATVLLMALIIGLMGV